VGAAAAIAAAAGTDEAPLNICVCATARESRGYYLFYSASLSTAKGALRRTQNPMRASQAGGGGGGGGKSGGSDCDWLRQPFAPWDESTAQHALTGLSLNGEQQQQQHPQKSEPKGAVACGVRGCPSAAPSHGDNGDNGGDDDHTAREKDAEFGGARKTYSVTSLDIETLGSPCNVVIRCREGRTPWECVVRAAVGDPVHLDIVLAKEGSAGAKFCFSSYMNQKFEMNMMDSSLVHDPAFTNIGLEVTEEELQRCTRFLTALDGRAAYSYFDAMVLVPLAPKVCPCHNATMPLSNGRGYIACSKPPCTCMCRCFCSVRRPTLL
jgi:hypothetical protein